MEKDTVISNQAVPPSPFEARQVCGNCARPWVRDKLTVLCPTEGWRLETDSCDNHQKFTRPAL